MTDIEAKAQALLMEVRKDRGAHPMPDEPLNRAYIADEAIYRAIEQHEAFKQEVSDAVQSWVDGGIDRSAYLWFRKKLEQFIIPKPKPKPDELVEVWGDLFEKSYNLDQFCAALEARGLEIREKGQ